jgi:hypothetical protein
MSKYPVLYHSKSKNADIAIEDMPTPHLLNAWRKMTTDENGPPEVGTTILCMETELRARGCTYDSETGRWTLPEEQEGSGGETP